MTCKTPFHNPFMGSCFRGCGTNGTKANRLPVVMEDTLVIMDALPSEKISSEWVYTDWELVVPIVETECRSSSRLGLSGSGGRARDGGPLMRICGIRVFSMGVEGSCDAFGVVVSISPADCVPACSRCVRRFLERITPSMMIAGSEGTYAIIAAGIDTIKRVESLANPASTLTKLEETGTSLSQSVNISIERLPNLMSSLIRMVNSSLGYSGSSIELVGEGESHKPDSRLPALVWLEVDEAFDEDVWCFDTEADGEPNAVLTAE